MFKEIKDVINTKNATQLFALIPEKKSITAKEAEIVILVGYALQYVMEHQTVKKYLSYLPLIQEIEITGLPEGSSQAILMNWIIEYYKVLYLLLDKLEISTKFIDKCLSSHIYSKKDEIISKYIQNSQKHPLYGIEIEAWGLSTHMSAELGRSILQTIYYRYLRGFKTDVKFTEVHSRIIALILAVIRNQTNIIEENKNLVSEVFKLTFKFSNKFVIKKISSKKLFIVCVEYQLYCLTFYDILQAGLTGFNLKSVYGKFPLINCWNYYSRHLLEMMNMNILLDILQLFLRYVPEMDETFSVNLVTSYLEIIENCSMFLKDYAEKILELVIEIMRNEPKCLDIFKSKVNGIPEYIRDDAKWAYVYLKLSDEDVPRIIKDSFKSLQSKEEVLHIFRILKDKILSSDYEELELILNELKKINHSSEITEFLSDCVVNMVKKQEKDLGTFNKQEEMRDKLRVIIRTFGEKAKEVVPNKMYNRFWVYLTHFKVQTGIDYKEIEKDLQFISHKTEWETVKIIMPSSAGYMHKIKQKLKKLYDGTIKSTYQDLLLVYTEYQILKHQYPYDCFLKNCLTSELPENMQEILLNEYFENLRKSPYDPYRISEDLIFLLKYIASNEHKEYVEVVINANSISKLGSCYCYQYIQILSHEAFFKFCMSLLGITSLGIQGEVMLKRLETTVFIKNPQKFMKFLLKFLRRSVAYGLCIVRTEILFCYSRFLKSFDNSLEDNYIKTFLDTCISIYTVNSVSYKSYYDLLKFHNWFIDHYGKSQKSLLSKSPSKPHHKKSISLKKAPPNPISECSKLLSQFQSVLSESSNPWKKIATNLLSEPANPEEFSREIYLFTLGLFKNPKYFQEGLSILTSIISTYPNFSRKVFESLRILLLEYIQMHMITIKTPIKTYIYHDFTTKGPKSVYTLSDGSLILLIRFLERQFHLHVLNRRVEFRMIGEIVEGILIRVYDRKSLVVLETCSTALRIARPEFELPNAYKLHVLAVTALMFVQKPDYKKKQVYVRHYIKLMKVRYRQLVISIILQKPSVIFHSKQKFVPGLPIWHHMTFEDLPLYDYSYIQPLMYVLSANFYIASAGENKLPSITQESINYLKKFPQIYTIICSLYSLVVENTDNSKPYEEIMYLFAENPGYSKLLEYLQSPLQAARSFAIKHLSRAPSRVQLFYLPSIISLSETTKHYSTFTRPLGWDDIFTLLLKISLSSALSGCGFLNSLKLSSFYKRNYEDTIGWQLSQYFLTLSKRNSYFWHDLASNSKFLYNLWAIVENQDFSSGIQNAIYKNFPSFHKQKLTLMPKSTITSIDSKIDFYQNNPVFLIMTKSGKKKKIAFLLGPSYNQACSYYYVLSLLISYLKANGVQALAKVQKIEKQAVKSQEKFGCVVDLCEIFPCDYKDIVESHACCAVLLFLLGLRSRSDELMVSKRKKVIIDTTKLRVAEKHFGYFVVRRKGDLEKFRFWVLTVYQVCRGIFENVLWSMKEKEWKKHKLHFYMTMPIMNAVRKIVKRINRDNQIG